MRGYEHANATALGLWEKTYPNALHIALTDTFSTEAFLKVRTTISLLQHLAHCSCRSPSHAQDFIAHPHFAQRWTGLRQDSGDPFAFAPRAKQVYEQLGVDYTKKTIIFSDALNVEKALKLKKQCDELGFKCTFKWAPSRTRTVVLLCTREAYACGCLQARSGSGRRCRTTL